PIVRDVATERSGAERLKRKKEERRRLGQGGMRIVGAELAGARPLSYSLFLFAPIVCVLEAWLVGAAWRRANGPGVVVRPGGRPARRSDSCRSGLCGGPNAAVAPSRRAHRGRAKRHACGFVDC